MRFQKYLVEKIIKINNKDLDMLWKPLKPISKKFDEMFKNFDKKHVNDVINTINDNITTKNEDGLIIKTFNSSELTSKKAQLAHKLNPVTIHMGAFKGNTYQCIKKIIQVGFNYDYIPELHNILKRGLLPSDMKRFQIEFKEQRIKAGLSHELTHWIDDTLHNFHIKRVVSRAIKHQDRSIAAKGEENVSLTDYEINAVISSINSYRKFHKKIWDKLTFDEVLELMPVEYFMNKILSKEWRLKIKKRMAREGILGKKMR